MSATSNKVTKSSNSRKVTRRTRAKFAIMRALYKVARMGASVGRRAKVAATRLARMTKSIAQKAARVAKAATARIAEILAPAAAQVARPFQAIGRVMQRGYRAAVDGPLGDIGRAVWSRVATTWRVALRPFLEDVGVLIGGAAWMASLMVAPVATGVATGLVGLVVLGLAKGAGWLERSRSRLAHMTRQALTGAMWLAKLAFYVGAGLMVTLMASTSLPFAVVSVLELVVRSLARQPAASLPRAVRALFNTRLVDVNAKVETVPVREAEVDAQAPISAVVEPTVEVVATGGFLRATGTEELWGTEHDRAVVDGWTCAACDAPESALRVRATAVTHATICTDCFEKGCEEDALRFTGVSLKARNVEVWLNKTGLHATDAYVQSQQNHDAYHWVPTGWWRDGKGTNHEREWTCLLEGVVVASIVNDHRRKSYRVMLGKRFVAAKASLSEAQVLASDTLDGLADTTGPTDVINFLDKLSAPAAVIPLFATGKA